MSRTKKPHVVFYMADKRDLEPAASVEVGPRDLAGIKKHEVAERERLMHQDPYLLIIYAGRLGEDLRYVETV